MAKGTIFWLIMIIALIFSVCWNSVDLRRGSYGVLGIPLLIFVLLFLLGWQVFGFIVQ